MSWERLRHSLALTLDLCLCGRWLGFFEREVFHRSVAPKRRVAQYHKTSPGVGGCFIDFNARLFVSSSLEGELSQGSKERMSVLGLLTIEGVEPTVFVGHWFLHAGR